MKKVVFILIVTVILFICIIFYEYEKNKYNPYSNFSNFSTYKYKCKDDFTECKVYTFYDQSIYFEKNHYTTKTELIPFNSENLFIKNQKDFILKTSYDEKIIVEQLKFEYDKNLNGTYIFNNGCYLSSNFENYKKCNFIAQMDENIIVLDNAIISEIPIYEYKFDDNNNLILSPVYYMENYIGLKRKITYKLKRQN